MKDDSFQRPSPEQLLAQIEQEERRERRGRLKAFLGYASGVGKSFQMLDEGRRRRESGEAVDVTAVLHRRPQVALVDGLAYDNPSGWLNAHRWQDVEQHLDAGISVMATVNLQFLEKLSDEVKRITGKRIYCTIP